MTRRELSTDFEEFLACLNRHGVDYLIVGSEAVAVYGAPRYSADFDTFVAPVAENLQRALKAIQEFGFEDAARAIDVVGWLDGKRTLEMGREPNQVHVLIDLSGVTYDEAAANATTGVYGETPVRFIGFDALLKNKLAAARPKDLADVAALGRVARARTDR
jgi:hypothetical protein